MDMKQETPSMMPTGTWEMSDGVVWFLLSLPLGELVPR